jgi:hypothetical protein
MAAFGLSTTLSDWVQTQPRRLQSRRLSHQSLRHSHQSRRLTSHADTVTSRILQAQPTSKTCPSPSIPYSFVTSPYFSEPAQLSRSNSRNTHPSGPHCQSVEHGSPDFDTLGRPYHNKVALLVRRTTENRELEKRRPSQPPPHQPKSATRGKMRNQSLKPSPHTHNPNFQKTYHATERSQSCNYTTTVRLLIRASAALSRPPLKFVKSPLKF